MRRGICSACAFGFHDDHDPMPVKPPPGVLGGVECRCEGECVDGRYKSEQTLQIEQMFAEFHRRQHAQPEADKAGGSKP